MLFCVVVLHFVTYYCDESHCYMLLYFYDIIHCVILYWHVSFVMYLRHFVKLFYVLSWRDVLYCVMFMLLCYVVLLCIGLRYFMLFNVVLCHFVIWCIIFNFVLLYLLLFCYNFLCHFVICCYMLCYYLLKYDTLCSLIQFYVILW